MHINAAVLQFATAAVGNTNKKSMQVEMALLSLILVPDSLEVLFAKCILFASICIQLASVKEMSLI